jgi:tRNA wybutosine-synthesizing protein 1
MNESLIDQYADLDKKAQPLFIEPKGYVFVGYSRKRMTLGNMPSHDQVKEFGRTLSEKIGYQILNEKKDSRVVLLGQNSQQAKL